MLAKSAVLVSLALCVPMTSVAASGQSRHEQKDPAVRGPILGTVPMVDFDEQYEIEQEKVRQYLAAVELQRQIDEYLNSLYQAQLQEQARQAAANRAAAAVPTIRTNSGSGPHSDAWWWGVAICEQGGRNDPYFGYFSWMDGSAAGLTWEQQVAKSNALLSRVSSESPAWAASCVAAGYRASPGG